MERSVVNFHGDYSHIGTSVHKNVNFAKVLCNALVINLFTHQELPDGNDPPTSVTKDRRHLYSPRRR